MESLPTRQDRILILVAKMNKLSVQRGRLLARLRPISDELANLRKEFEKLLMEEHDAHS